MSLQWVSRAGVLRHLHLGDAMARPSRVTGLQNQLRRLCLSSQSRLTPQVGALSTIISQQSHSYATDASRPKPKKSTKATDGTRKKSTTPKKKRELTEKQKEAKEKKKQRDHIKQLKETALEPPKKLIAAGNRLAFQSKFSELRPQYSTIKEAFGAASTAVKEMAANETERFQNQAEENRVANEASLASWLKQYTPLQIKEANSARRSLARLTGKPARPIVDDRLVKRPMTAFFWFMSERKASGDLKYMQASEVAKQIAQEWKDMTETEKAQYQKMQANDQERYIREHNEVYGVEPKRTKQA
ncbi:uncharacterized protein N7484_010880 [Penicillium longicatenatum]|uniref:uncharacterized protein n=1 Tax=Penicillium longicatenatum TaxID=1561947 RepID=UPI002549B986|nr:uncharacterized protein N7484_010880 [Penicillium longicatenatum]KAJ5630780.1 hypothetical protein N7484_010880 [Penicillium longicatenatum]